jgi:hypothetical protein
MNANRKASINKRARELAQKDRVKDREARRAERKVRAEHRAANGIVGPEIETAPPPDPDAPADGDGDPAADAGDASDASDVGGVGDDHAGDGAQPLPGSGEG